MSDSNTYAGPAAGGAPKRGYGLPNQAAPLPRQWQLQLPPAARGQVSVQQQFHPYAMDAADWQLPSVLRTERAMLVGLWLLVMLTAIAIGLRLLDLSALTVTPSDLPHRSAAFASDAAALAADSMDEDPMFDDPLPVQPPARLSAPPSSLSPRPPPQAQAPMAAPVPAARPRIGLAAAAMLSADRPYLAPPPVFAHGASASCPDALRAMQLCPQ